MKSACLILAMAAACAAEKASPDTCVRCHAAETATFAQSPMSRALESAKESEILQTNQKLSVTLGAYSYEIQRSAEGSAYLVTDGRQSLRFPIEWGFGRGSTGQTFVYQSEGKWYESRVSYFAALRGLDLTLGADPSPPDLAHAAGRLVPPTEMRRCFECHATNVAKTGTLPPATMREGVQCERCHGSAVAHLIALGAGTAAKGRMPKLSAMTTEELSDFCGECHRTWSQVAVNGPRGIQNIRFQPYRLASSRCYDAADRRIKCTACHDPHRPLETSASAYDAKCKACHSPNAVPVTAASRHLCRAGSANCVTCHMPRLELPGAHRKFTDHRIRIARSNESYPDGLP